MNNVVIQWKSMKQKGQKERNHVFSYVSTLGIVFNRASHAVSSSAISLFKSDRIVDLPFIWQSGK